MIKTHVRERQSGKTTEITTRLRENEKLIALTFNIYVVDLYPEDIRDRVFTFYQFNNHFLRGLQFNKILIDEGYLMAPDDLAEFYYSLGRQGYEVEVYGSY